MSLVHTLSCSVLFAFAFDAAALTCPQMPEPVTNIQRDVKVEASAAAGSLGKIKAGELSGRVEVEAKNLYSKYPNADRIYAQSMMSATYCDMLRTSSIPESEKLNRWEIFQARLLGFAPLAKANRSDEPLPPGEKKLGEGIPPEGTSTTPRKVWLIRQDINKPCVEFYSFRRYGEGNWYNIRIASEKLDSGNMFLGAQPTGDIVTDTNFIYRVTVPYAMKEFMKEKLNLLRQGGRMKEAIVMLRVNADGHFYTPILGCD